jgi:histone deacetylase complex regulatory component SIN3
MRFLHQPQIYKNFLEILHTFHREQHTIKDVYEQVAYLFQVQPSPRQTLALPTREGRIAHPLSSYY